MRIVLIHPNYHSGDAEIAGNRPPAWVAYLAGHLKVAVTQTSCCFSGDDTCRFEIAVLWSRAVESLQQSLDGLVAGHFRFPLR